MSHDLQSRIEESAELRDLKDRINTGLTLSAGGLSTFDPILVIMVISLIVQVATFCYEWRSHEEIKEDLKNVKKLPPRKLMRFTRRANVLWRDYCKARQIDPGTRNPIFDAVYGLSSTLTDAEAEALLKLAQ